MEAKGSHRKLMPFWKKTISGAQNLRVLEPYENISVFMFPEIFFLHWVFIVACRLFLVTCRPSLAVVPRLSCPEACGILVLQAGIDPKSPALEGRFSTSEPPRKSLILPVIQLECDLLGGGTVSLHLSILGTQ